MATPNNRKILPDANKFDYMQSAFTSQQINGQIQENPTLNNSAINVPAFTKTAIITAKIEPAEVILTEGMRFVEYRAEEVVQYFDVDAGDMSWKKVIELTDNVTGPNHGAAWNNSLSEPFSNIFDNLIAFLNVKYNVGDIVTVSYLDNAYQPVEIVNNQVQSKDLGIGINNWGQRWFITGGLPKDGSETWNYKISEDRTSIDIITGSGSIQYISPTDHASVLCTDCIQADGLKVFQSGQVMEFSADSSGGASLSFPATATSGVLSFFFNMKVRNNTAIVSQAGFSTMTANDFFTVDPTYVPTDTSWGTKVVQGYELWRGDSQLTSPYGDGEYEIRDFDVWIIVPLAKYKAHASIADGTFHIYDLSPLLKRTLFLSDYSSYSPDPTEGLVNGGCGITTTTGTGTGTGTTSTTITLSLDTEALLLNNAGGFLIETTDTSDCAIEIDQTALALAMAGDCLTAVNGVLNVDTTCTGGGTGTNVIAGCGLEFGTGTLTTTLSITPGDLDGNGLKVGAGNCDLAVDQAKGLKIDTGQIVLGIDTLADVSIDPYSATFAYYDPVGGVHYKEAFDDIIHAFTGYTSGNDQFLVHQGGGTIEWVNEGDGIFISAAVAQLDIMSCSTVTPTIDDFLAFGNTGVGIANEKASFSDFLESITSYNATSTTQVLGHINGAFQWFDKGTSCP